MNREFMELYNRELALFYEHAEEFAEEYPGVAERLGAMTQDNPDPMIGAVLEGSAFLATRVQLKLKHEFSTFTDSLLEQLVPNFLAPIPSVFQAQAVPEFGDEALRDGMILERGSYLDAAYRERDRSIACRYRLSCEIAVWPLTITRSEYLGSVAPIEALGLTVGPEAMAGLRMSFRVRSTRNLDAEPPLDQTADKPNTWAKGLKIPYLKVHCIGPEAEAVSIYEQIFGHTAQIALRWQGHDNRWRSKMLPVSEVLEQIGFNEDEALYPVDHRVFRGFDYIRDYFTFPQKYLGFSIKNLGKYLNDVDSPIFELVFVFNDVSPRLSTVVDEGSFALFCASAINLFEKTCDRVFLKENDFEYQVVPERTRYLEFEPHRVLTVAAHRAGEAEKITVFPLYSSPEDQTIHSSAMFYSVRRLQRRRTSDENKYGLRSDYMGTDMFLTLVGHEKAEERGEEISELSIRALCSNRHLPEHLPVGETGADFVLLDNDQIKIRAIGQPTHPREPIVSGVSDRSRPNYTGENSWRLVNMLGLNHLGLVQNRAGENARAIKDVLSLFADLNDSVTERRIRGVRTVDSKPVSRRVRALSGVAVARGLEVTITMEDKAFEGSGVFLLGAVLDRFFAEYVSLNQFTQTVIRTPERKEIMRWPPRLGRRQVL
ncbi:MAG: type VI secretion system baseplate subunit TssF [Pseudomonadota bacterium]